MSDEIKTIKENVRILGSNVRDDINRFKAELASLKDGLAAVMEMQTQINSNLEAFYNAMHVNQER